jgi:hypothetical protein
MRRILAAFSWTVIAIGFLLASERQAHAYADPGSSLFMLQAAGALVTATGLYFRRMITGLFKGRSGANLERKQPPPSYSPE